MTDTDNMPRESCHNCRRRRRKCDRSLPHCQKCHRAEEECLGYGKFFSWVNGVASRGKMMGKSFDKVVTASLGLDEQKPNATSLQHSSCPQPVMFMDQPLTDPFLQDLNRNSRFYLFYFNRYVCRDLVIYDDTPDQNPFHELIPFTKEHKALFYIILSTSALHLYNVTQRQSDTIPTSRPSPNLKAGLAKSACTGQLKNAPPLFYQHALIAKQKALRLLYLALTDPIETTGIMTLASVLLFINLELMDSGKNDWRPHVEGARRLTESLECLRNVQTTSTDSLRDCMISNCLVYEILGTTLTRPAKPAAFQNHTGNVSCILKNAEVNNYLSCPAELLEIVHSVPQLLRDTDDIPTQSLPIVSCRVDHSSLLLKRVWDFNALSWATTLQRTSPRNDLEERMHIASAHQAAVCIYIIDAFRPSSEATDRRNDIELLVSSIIDHLNFITPEDGLYKATSWPTFVVGAASMDLERRKWALNRLCRLWEVCPWGYIKSATELLEMIWQRHRRSEVIINWVQTLRELGVDWLIA